MSIRTALKHIFLSIIDLFVLTISNTLILCANLLSGFSYIILSLLLIIFAGLLSGMTAHAFMAIILLIMVPIVMTILLSLSNFLLNSFKLISEYFKRAAQKLFLFHTKVELYWHEDITAVTENNKLLHIPFITCHLARFIYVVTQKILKYLYIPTIIISIIIIGYGIHSFSLNFEDSIAQMYIEYFDYFSTDSRYLNILMTIFLFGGIIACAIVSTLSLKTTISFLELICFNEYLDRYNAYHRQKRIKDTNEYSEIDRNIMELNKYE